MLKSLRKKARRELRNIINKLNTEERYQFLHLAKDNFFHPVYYQKCFYSSLARIRFTSYEKEQQNMYNKQKHYFNVDVLNQYFLNVTGHRDSPPWTLTYLEFYFTVLDYLKDSDEFSVKTANEWVIEIIEKLGEN